MGGKRHTSQNHQQKMGQFYTKKSDLVLEGFENVVKGKRVLDPFAGENDLLNWAVRNGCSSIIGYDIEPKIDGTIQNDSIKNPPDYSGYVVVSNPPYLSKNKAKGDKTAYDIWNQNDLYKCHLASLATKGCEETIQIIPSNFFSESRDAIRKLVFSDYSVVKATYWTVPVFDDATTGITVVHMRKGGGEQSFSMTMLPNKETFGVSLKQKYGYLFGDDFFDLIESVDPIKVLKTDVGMPRPNTNLVIGLLDNGKWPFGLSYNEGDPIYSNPKAITTYQVTLPGYSLDESQQREICCIFQRVLSDNRKKYHGLFLSNYMGADQKILSRNFAHKLLSYSIREVLGPKKSSLERFFAKTS